MITGWAGRPVVCRQIVLTGPEGSRGAFAVNDQLDRLAVHDVALDLGRVVADVVDDGEPERARVLAEDARKDLAHAMRDHLPVGERAVGGSGHGAEVRLAVLRPKRRAGELPVPDGNAVARHHLIEAPDIVGRDLMAEAPRSAMEHHTHLPRRADPERPGRHRIVDALGPYHLDLEVVVARAQRPELVHAARHRAGAHLRGIGPRQAAAPFHVVEVLGPAITLGHTPARAGDHHLGERRLRQMHESVGSHS